MISIAPAYEIVGDAASELPIVFTCEHASNRVPTEEPTAADRPFLEDHWGWDIGAADLTRRLVERVGGVGVLSRFSRLLCDPNRTPEESTFIVSEVDGHALDLNRDLSGDERRRRQQTYYEPYHRAVDEVLQARIDRCPGTSLVSIHSFTARFRGEQRPMEIGVLFDAHEARAAQLHQRLLEQGFVVADNEPYSGYAGLIHAARLHGRRHRIPYVELEIRQDLIETRPAAEAIADRVATALSKAVLDWG